MLLEGRAPLEYLSMLAAFPWLRRLPRGDGHPVMVFPGLGANDATTWPLRGFLRSLGYVTQAWGQGFNAGPRVGVLDRCAADIRNLADRTGEPVSLLGWSLGGLYAREMAKEHPEITRCVITLGTPFTGHPRDTNAWRVYEWLTGTSVGDPDVMAQMRIAPPVPMSPAKNPAIPPAVMALKAFCTLKNADMLVPLSRVIRLERVKSMVLKLPT